ncbi:methyl-accepting chemotaxis protein [Clostridium cavendishii DSM 21758]|uniref:Methyl-accepting chemotaxis protein n=1 Tax=Clostridium cavendishii DSM 21758 TaxID=1121302 RepID=A0A1M6TVG1_9CLOT|nr:methyl-accepting chemotaxis protein [Clostridium cavendishii]SHK60916.1 methyl-accepting chemotaxis protein [Clostridium cavendishii DSM 21758]
MKLKSKFITFFIVFAIVPILLAGIIVEIAISRNIYNDEETRLKVQSEMSKNSIVDTITLLQKIGIDISTRNDINKYLTNVNSGIINEDDKNKLITRFQGDIKRYTDFDDIVLINKNGTALLNAVNTLEGKDLSQMEYYTKMKSSKAITVSKVKKSVASGNPIVIVAIPILENNELKGSLLTSISLTNISKNYINNVKIGETGYVYVVESDGTMLAHPKPEEILNQNFNKVEISKKVLSAKNGFDEYTYNGVSKIISYSTDETLGWTFIANVPLTEVNKISDLTMKIMLIIGAVTIVVVAFFASLIARRLSNPIVKVSEAMRKISEGDLTVTVDIKGKDEIAKMTENINNTLNSLKGSISGVQDTSVVVEENASSLKNSAGQMSSSAGEVASAIQEVARGATDQAAELVDIASVLTTFSEELAIVERSLLNVSMKTDESQYKAVNGKDKIDMLLESITSITSSFNVVTSKINGLSSTVSKIGNITDAINAISEQTNLLALNAAIEAARAGEQGKGFAVVAEEVRKLAEESRNSSEEILLLIKTIANETNDVITTTEDVKVLLTQQKGIAEDTTDSFNNIITSINDITPLMNETKNSLDNANKSKDVVNNKVQGISAVSEEVSASAEEIAASAEELMSSSEQLAEMAGKMDDASENLKTKIDVFKIN